MTARILGIDAGFVAMGLVLAEGRRILEARVLRTERGETKRAVRVADDDAERCQVLARGLWAALQEWRPAGAVVELPHAGAQGARANRSMGMATGIVVACLEVAKLPAEWVTPAHVKAAAGSKGASKADVEEAVRAAFDWCAAVVPKAASLREHVMDAAGALLAARQGTLLRALAMRA